MVKPGEPIPEPFSSFEVKPMRDLIKGPYVRNALAVVVDRKDLNSMVRFAVQKLLSKFNSSQSLEENNHNMEPGDREGQFKQRLLKSGLLADIKKPPREPPGNRTPIRVGGKPVSQLVIEERR